MITYKLYSQNLGGTEVFLEEDSDKRKILDLARELVQNSNTDIVVRVKRVITTTKTTIVEELDSRQLNLF